MNTANTTSPRKKVIIFFDCQHSEVCITAPWDIESYCMSNNWDVLRVVYKLSQDDFFNYEILLHDIKKHQDNGNEQITVIIDKDTYELPENLISCAILGALERLKLIKICVYEYLLRKNDKNNKIVIRPYNEQKHPTLLKQAVNSLNHLTGNMNVER